MNLKVKKKLEAIPLEHAGLDINYEAEHAKVVVNIEAFPDDITAVGPRDLGRLRGRYVGLLSFVNSQLSEHRWCEKKVRAELKLLRSQMVFVTRGRYKIDVLSKVTASPEVRGKMQELLEVQARVSVLFSLLFTLKEYISACDQEILRRRQG